MERNVDSLIKQTIEIIHKNKSHGDYFNLLKIAGVSSSEVFTHTPILKELLDPNGSHGQKAFFLKSFIKYLGLDFQLDEYVSIKKEFRCENGQIDILIQNKNKAMIIENKIYAEDQNKQLNRYYNYCIGQKKHPLIIYLTLNGDEPSASSLGVIKKLNDQYVIVLNDEQHFVDLRCISYAENIINWLESVLTEVQLSNNLVSAISQYVNLLKLLTDKVITGGKELNMMLENLNSEELAAIKLISRQFDSSEYRGYLLFQLFSSVQKKIIDSGNFIISDDYENILFTKENCAAWFEQVSTKNPAIKRNVIGCALKCKKNAKLIFLFIVATNDLHYGIVLDGISSEQLKVITKNFPTWKIRPVWKKIKYEWISHDIGNLRKFSEDTFKLLGLDNRFLDSFINDRINDLEILDRLLNLEYSGISKTK